VTARQRKEVRALAPGCNKRGAPGRIRHNAEERADPDRDVRAGSAHCSNRCPDIVWLKRLRTLGIGRVHMDRPGTRARPIAPQLQAQPSSEGGRDAQWHRERHSGKPLSA
jgi:hypothetical protein